MNNEYQIQNNKLLVDLIWFIVGEPYNLKPNWLRISHNVLTIPVDSNKEDPCQNQRDSARWILVGIRMEEFEA
jgi:hypothetical protein